MLSQKNMHVYLLDKKACVLVEQAATANIKAARLQREEHAERSARKTCPPLTAAPVSVQKLCLCTGICRRIVHGVRFDRLPRVGYQVAIASGAQSPVLCRDSVRHGIAHCSQQFVETRG